MGNGEGGDDEGEFAEAAEGDDEAGEEEEVIGAIEDVFKAKREKAPSGLVPGGIEGDDAWVVVELEGADIAGGRGEA